MKVRTPSVKSRFGAVFLGFRWLLAVGGLLFLGLSSCENEKPNNISLSPKIEDRELEKPTIEPISSGTIVYLNMSTFKIVKVKSDSAEVILNKGVDVLLMLYSNSQSDVNQILSVTKTDLSKDTISKTLLDNYLKEYKEIRSKHPKFENFSKFVDALEYANKVLVEDKVNYSKISSNKSSLPDDTQSSNSFWYIFFLVAFSILIRLFFVSKNSKKQDETTIKREIEAERDLTRSLQAIERKHFEAEQKRLEAERKLKELESNKTASETILTPVVPIIETAYFPISVSRNVFYNAAKSLVPIAGHSFYVFKINPDKVTATFQIWDNPDAHKLLIDKGLMATESFCEFVNERATSNKIVTLKVGEVELKDNKWLVKTKSVVEYLTVTTPSVKTPILATPKAETTEIAYFSCPINERVFNNSTKLSAPRAGATFYIFDIAKGGLTATFEFWNNPDAVERAIDKAHSHIDAACDILNDRDLKATHILTEEAGVAELKNGKWIVKTKAKIKYEL